METSQTLGLKVAERVKSQLSLQPASNIGVPTGRTPLELYRILARWSKDGELDWSRTKCFGLDEYIDVDEAGSFRRYLEQHLYKHTNIKLGNRFSPVFCANYDQVIAMNGGLDLTLLGIGKNGHIAFNEPGTPLESWTHSIWLTESTRIANAEFFGRIEQTPTRAVTMGVSTILASRQIVLMVSGKQKKGILDRAMSGPITPEVPASYLQLHKNLTIITDFDI